MVHDVKVIGSQVLITMVPTFAGCPALDFIKRDVQKAVGDLPWVSDCEVHFSFEEKWSTDAITDEGKTQLKNTESLRHQRTTNLVKNGRLTVRIAARTIHQWKTYSVQPHAAAFSTAQVAATHSKP